jgi:hypothetical protein
LHAYDIILSITGFYAFLGQRREPFKQVGTLRGDKENCNKFLHRKKLLWTFFRITGRSYQENRERGSLEKLR